MDLSQPGTWALGPDQTLNIVAALVRTAGSKVVLKPEQLEFTAEDTLRFEVDEAGSFVLLFGQAATDDEVSERLTALGLKPETATEEQRLLVKQLIKTIQLGA